MNKKVKLKDVLKQDNIEGLIDPNTYEPLVKPLTGKESAECMRITTCVSRGDSASLNMSKEKLGFVLYTFAYKLRIIGMYEMAFVVMSMAAEQGNAYASYLRGEMLVIDDGCRDLKQAFDCFLSAAKAGLVPAMVRVYIMLQSGLGVDQNDSEADFWYDEAFKVDAKAAVEEFEALYKCKG